MKTTEYNAATGLRQWWGRTTWLVPAVAVLMTTGCGTTSALKSGSSGGLESVRQYGGVSVLDFADRTPKETAKNKAPSEVAERMRERGRHFSDLIAAELTRTGAFEKVTRSETALPGTLVVAGEITRLKEGNSSLRFWVGMGAGSSYFDATVRILEADSQRELGQVAVDKNSWALGGGLAAKQTVDNFMEGAAKKVAADLAQAKTGKPAAK